MRCSVHRLGATRVLLSALLYGALIAFATVDARDAGAAAREPHVALILPLASHTFSSHADAVRQGFVAAAKAAGKNAPPVRIYSVNEDTVNVLTIYEQAVESGAQLVVGPLTRNGVAVIAASNLVTVPTLALNSLERGSPQPARLYLFGLSVELEARQVARLAFDDGRRNAFILSDDTTLGNRMREAFLQEFARFGGITVAELSFSADPSSLNKLRQAANRGVAYLVFFALDFARARVVRPFLGNALALYAASQVSAGRSVTLAARDLNLVRFVDMPWLLQADHPAVMIYPPPQFGDLVEFDRLYALGIDAFRIGLELLRLSPEPGVDGVTGRIRLTRDHQFVRELTTAQYVDGKTVILSVPR